MSNFTLLTFVFLGATLLNCGGSTRTTTAADSETGGNSASAAQANFESLCSSCHGIDGRSGSENRDIVQAASANISAAQRTVTNGDGRMPAFSSQLTSEQIRALLEYVATL